MRVLRLAPVFPSSSPDPVSVAAQFAQKTLTNDKSDLCHPIIQIFV